MPSRDLPATHAAAQPAVTDADVLLGLLDPDYFLGGDMKLDRKAATAAVALVATELGLPVEETAAGIHDVVNQNMAAAARISAHGSNKVGISPASR